MKRILNNIFQIFLNIKNNKHYSRKTYLGVVYAEIFKGTFIDVLKRPVFERQNSIWNDLLFIVFMSVFTDCMCIHTYFFSLCNRLHLNKICLCCFVDIRL